MLVLGVSGETLRVSSWQVPGVPERGSITLRREAESALFRDLPDALHLKVVEAKTFSSGTMLHAYAPRGWGRGLS